MQSSTMLTSSYCCTVTYIIIANCPEIKYQKTKVEDKGLEGSFPFLLICVDNYLRINKKGNNPSFNTIFGPAPQIEIGASTMLSKSGKRL